MCVIELDQHSRALWAKSEPYHPLWCHLLDVAAVCERLVGSFGCPDGLSPAWTACIAALHDIGKADPEFQVQDELLADILWGLGLPLPSRKEPFRHESRSGQWVSDHLADAGLGRRAVRLAGDVLRGHHGNFAPRPCSDDSVGYERWEAIRSRIAGVVTSVLGVSDEPAPSDFVHTDSTAIKLVGLVVLADWIASNDELYRYPALDREASPAGYWNQARQEAGRAVGALSLDGARPETVSEPPSFSNIWPGFTELKPSQKALQKACLDGLPPGLAIIEAPMGEGKTESAIYLAEYWRGCSGASGTYIGLPTTATSNQMHRRYADFLGKRRPHYSAPRLVHGMAWLIDDETPESCSVTYGDHPEEERLLAREWFAPSKRALLATEGVGTIDQALMGALNVKHGFLRLLGLSSKVLIIDEVHAYDEYMTTILERLLSWCRTLRIPVILLSATLSDPQKRRLIEAYGGKAAESAQGGEPYPLITSVPLDGSGLKTIQVPSQAERRVRVEQHFGVLDNARATAKLAATLVSDGGCACVLANTVRQAQAIYEELCGLIPDPDQRLLFHARYPAYRRCELEDKVVGLFGKDAIRNGMRPEKAVLVATQVVEQSLDLDFDVMISQLAPVDLLLQRVGRLRRHKELLPDSARPVEEALHVLMPDRENPAFGASEFVYGKHVLLQTTGILRDLDEFHFPDVFRPLIDACYGDGCVMGALASEREQELARLQWEHDREVESGKAAECLIPPPNPRLFSLAEAMDARDESDEATDSYFQISTRLGDRTRSVLLLEDFELLDAARADKAPGKEILRKLFAHKVDVPAWWIGEALPEDGFEPLYSDAKWLRRTVVVPMRDGRWCGCRAGKSFSITYDDTIGVERKEGDD